MDLEQTTNSTLNETKPKVVSISKRKRTAKIGWCDTVKEKPPGDTLLVGVYKYYTEDEDWEWDFKFMYYDEREFWIDDDMRITPAPLYWFVVTPPNE